MTQHDTVAQLEAWENARTQHGEAWYEASERYHAVVLKIGALLDDTGRALLMEMDAAVGARLWQAQDEGAIFGPVDPDESERAAWRRLCGRISVEPTLTDELEDLEDWLRGQ